MEVQGGRREGKGKGHWDKIKKARGGVNPIYEILASPLLKR